MLSLHTYIVSNLHRLYCYRIEPPTTESVPEVHGSLSSKPFTSIVWNSYISSTDIYQREVSHHNPSQDRQHHCTCLHQQNDGDCITYTFASNQGSMVMVYGKEYPVTCLALTRSIEFHCRQAVKDLVRQIRMEVLPSLLSEDQSSAGASLKIPVCKQVVSSIASLYQMETTGNSLGCFYSGLVQYSSEAICQSPMEPILSQILNQEVQEGIILVVPV